MKYRINPAGNRIVDATPEETRALRPCIAAAYRRWRAHEGDIEDFCQEVEIVVWQAIAEQRVPGAGFKRPEDALLDFMFAVAWNVWRNHTRKRSTRNELLVDVMPDMVGPHPEARIDARAMLLRLTTREDVACILLLSLNGPRPELIVDLPRATFWGRVRSARQWVRGVDAGNWRRPLMPDPSTPKLRKKKR